VAQQCIAHPLAVQHTAGDDHPAERAVGGLPQQHADVGDPTEVVDPYRHGIDVDEGHVGPDVLQLFAIEPAGLGVGLLVGHALAVVK
jgi:hypothetical protein